MVKYVVKYKRNIGTIIYYTHIHTVYTEIKNYHLLQLPQSTLQSTILLSLTSYNYDQRMSHSPCKVCRLIIILGIPIFFCQKHTNSAVPKEQHRQMLWLVSGEETFLGHLKLAICDLFIWDHVTFMKSRTSYLLYSLKQWSESVNCLWDIYISCHNYA